MTEFFLNGSRCTTDLPGSTPAVFALRNHLGSRDVRLGCGEGHCGCCTVLVDGRPTTTCNLPFEALHGCQVTTVRGLATSGSAHPVQEALIEEQAGQCGYCLSGIIATAVALYERPQRPNDDEIRTALDSHLCRCGAHGRILAALSKAIETKSVL